LRQQAKQQKEADAIESLEALKKNEFFHKQTFEEFLERKKTGKRALFYLKPTRTQQVQLFEEYRKQITDNQNSKLKEKMNEIEEDRKRLE
jgi:hypothetical protein